MTKAIVTILITEDQLARLQSRCEVVFTGWGKTGECLSEQELTAVSRDAEILLVEYETISRILIKNLPGLKLLGCARANPVNIDITAASERRIPVLFTPGRNANAAAEFTIGLMLAESRHIARSHYALKTNCYLGEARDTFDDADPKADVIWTLNGKSPYKDFRGGELCDRILGLIGLGNVGVRVAILAKAFGMQVVAYSPLDSVEKAEKLGVKLVALDDLLMMSDFVSVNCKVTNETQQLLGKREFAMMKPSAYFINTARAIIADQEALLKALQNHRIAGAALDVYWYEPIPCNHPLLQLDNITLTPHLAGDTIEVATRHSKMIVDDVMMWLDGNTPEHIFIPDAL
jgi:D-3-phosphoglycerate dehydrogenase